VDRAAYVVAVEFGQVAVEPEDVVVERARLGEGGPSVERHVDRGAGAPQSAGHRFRDSLFVLGNQHTHGANGRSRNVCGSSSSAGLVIRR
jgi:hypothetical protein